MRDKKPKYPKNLDECLEILERNENTFVVSSSMGIPISSLAKLIVARGTYWKILGEEMGLNKPWKPDWKGDSWRQLKYCIIVNGDGELERRTTQFDRRIFAFPTEEMMNAFYENFKDKLEICKEFI